MNERLTKHLYTVNNAGVFEHRASGYWADVNKVKEEIQGRNLNAQADARVHTVIYDANGYRRNP